MAFLLNILRVLVTKLRQSRSSETHQARKSVKAALVLLPLLGLTNFLNMLDAPLERSAIVFGLWSYTTHILTSCQGLILAFLYCFRNGEVQMALKKFVRYRMFHGSGVQCFGSTTGRLSVARGGTIEDEANVIELTNSYKPKFAQIIPTQLGTVDQHQIRISKEIQTDCESCVTPTPNSETCGGTEEDDIIPDDTQSNTENSIQEFGGQPERRKTFPILQTPGVGVSVV
ncbi:unnamed protein product, partial [Allacma fusca]